LLFSTYSSSSSKSEWSLKATVLILTDEDYTPPSNVEAIKIVDRCIQKGSTTYTEASNHT
jgi:hypothetical protein